jgi:hypothetical protein
MKQVKYIILCTGIFLLVFGKSNGEFSRSGYALWDLGHILIWALGTHLMVYELNLFTKKPVYMQFLLIGSIALALGIISEISQIFSQRSADINDLIKDCIGIVVGLFFFNRRKEHWHAWLVRSIQGGIIVVCAIQIIPFVRAGADEIIARIQFPVLSNFETPFEPDRWITKGRENISEDVVYEGKRAFKAALRPEKYAGFSLDFFPRDWSGFKTLAFAVFNPAADTLALQVRIDDQDHRLSGFEFSDRFNSSCLLSPGWNQIQIDLDMVKQAPQTREMDLKHIKRLILFFIQPADWLTVYLDDVKLIK